MEAGENGLRGTENTGVICWLRRNTMNRDRVRGAEPEPIVAGALSTFTTSGVSKRLKHRCNPVMSAAVVETSRFRLR